MGRRRLEIKGFPSPGANRSPRDGNPLFPSWEHIENRGCGSYFTILGNESTKLLFRAKRVNDFTIWGGPRIRFYREYLGGKSYFAIGQGLTADGIRTAAGNDFWLVSTLQKILTNTRTNGRIQCTDFDKALKLKGFWA